MMTPKKRAEERRMTHIDDIGPSARTLQLIFGLVMGVIFGTLIMFKKHAEPGDFSWDRWLLCYGGAPALFGALAWFFGDRFWFFLFKGGLRRRYRFWRPMDRGYGF